jgi:glutathione S-transferase
METPILFIIPGACSLGSQISLEWLQTPYKVGITTLEIRQSAEFRQINPAGKVGALKDGKHLVAENLAILLYLADKSGNDVLCPPASHNGRTKVYQWLSYISSTLHPAFQHFNYPTRFVGEDYAEHFQTLALERLNLVLQYINDNLLASGYFIGDAPTIVDAQAYGLLRWCRKHSRGENLVNLHAFPKVNNFLDQMGKLVAVKNALAIEQDQAELASGSLFAGYFQFGVN